MKKYVILASGIVNMGGGQMYIRNKCIWMKEHGWVVDLISVHKGKVFIPELREYDTFIPELGFDFFLYSETKRNKIVNKIVSRILDGVYDEIVIESSSIPGCTWAEVVAEKCHAKHLSYLLQEDNTLYSNINQDFFKFKLKCHELASITESSMYDMFAPFSHITKQQSSECYLPAYCNNVVEDIDSEWIEQIKSYKYDYLIGCLSRLDKPFIVPAFTDFIKYVKAHTDKQFLFVMLGGAPEGSGFERNIKNMFKNLTNVNIIVTGYLFPVSTKLLDLFDAFFTSAGSSWVCMRSGVPTISIDGNDFQPIGILGRTTNHSLFRDEHEQPVCFDSLMDRILLTKEFVKEQSSHELNKPNFSSHDDFLNRMSKEKSYYSFKDIRLSGSEKKLKFILSICGPSFYFYMNAFKKKITKATNSDR